MSSSSSLSSFYCLKQEPLSLASQRISPILIEWHVFINFSRTTLSSCALFGLANGYELLPAFLRRRIKLRSTVYKQRTLRIARQLPHTNV